MMISFLKHMAFVLALAAAAPATAAPVGPAEEFPVPDGFTGATWKVDGVSLHYVAGGHGPLVLLVHGFDHWLPEECAVPLNQAVMTFLNQN